MFTCICEFIRGVIYSSNNLVRIVKMPKPTAYPYIIIVIYLRNKIIILDS